MNTRFVALVLVGIAGGTAHAAKPNIQWDNAYDFSSVRTYQWQPTDSPLATDNPLMHNRVEAGIEARLKNAGLTETRENPDVYVTYHTTTETNVRLDSDSLGYGYGGFGGPGWGAWGYGFNGPISTTTTVSTYDTNTLIVDIVDANRSQLVWRGSYARVFSENPQKAEKQVDAAIEAMARQWQKIQKKN
jgi:hypothetical protein